MKTLNDLLQVSLDCVLFTCVAGSRAYGTLAEYHAARLEHAQNTFRLYYYQQKAEGCEGDLTLLTQQRLDAYTSEFMSLDTYATRTPRPTKASHEPLDAILRQWAM
jgi:hypothetical protein